MRGYLVSAIVHPALYLDGPAPPAIRPSAYTSVGDLICFILFLSHFLFRRNNCCPQDTSPRSSKSGEPTGDYLVAAIVHPALYLDSAMSVRV